MSAAPSKTGIANNVLTRLGATERLTDLASATTNSAVQLRGLWDDCRRLLLSLHPFNCAIKRAWLNQHGDVPEFGWTRKYQLPADCQRWLPPSRRGDSLWFDGEREGDFILTNRAPPLPIRYVFDNEVVPSWSPSLVAAMTLTLAEWMAEGVTQSSGITDRMTDAAARAVKLAKRMDGLETGATQRTRLTARSDWLAARNRGWHGYRG